MCIRDRSYTEQDLEKLNDMRLVMTDLIENVKESIGRYNTAEEKIKGLYKFLSESFRMPEDVYKRQLQKGGVYCLPMLKITMMKKKR